MSSEPTRRAVDPSAACYPLTPRRPEASCSLLPPLIDIPQSKHEAESRKSRQTAQPGERGKFLRIPQPEKTFPKNIVWSLYSFNGKPVSGELNFLIDDNNRGTGSSGCNTWSATMVPANGQRIGMGPIAITKKLCAKEVMQMEVGYLVGLRSGPFWDLVGPDIVIKAAQGGGEMKFKRSL